MQPIDQQRKDDHLIHALKQHAVSPNTANTSSTSTSPASSFDNVRFVHHAIQADGIAQSEISLTTQWAGTEHAVPLYINGMTGGSPAAKRYNQQLAEIARETGLPMASGSMSISLKNPTDDEIRESFTVIRSTHQEGFVLANLGAGKTLEDAKKVVEWLEADALQIHLNRPQEVIMPEGDRDFSKWSDHIQNIIENVGVPVVVKEVGFGMSRESIEYLIQLGAQTIDISGRGGTNFAQIENLRRDHLDFTLLENWGQTTAESLLESLPYQDQTEILASGGIRHYYDAVRAFALGARAVGLSGHLLHLVDQGGVAAGVEFVQSTLEAIRHCCLLLNARRVTDIAHCPIVLTDELKDWATARGIDYLELAQRQ